MSEIKVEGTRSSGKSLDVNLNKVLSDINLAVNMYMLTYHDEPELIMISKDLEYVLLYKLETTHQYAMLNHKEYKIHYLFGIPVISSKVLNYLEFEVR